MVDAGLFTGVLGLTENDLLSDGDLLGRLLETFVVAQIRSEVALMSPPPRLHHLRMSEDHHEIDLVIEVGPRRLIAIEIKATVAIMGGSPSRAGRSGGTSRLRRNRSSA